MLLFYSLTAGLFLRSPSLNLNRRLINRPDVQMERDSLGRSLLLTPNEAVEKVASKTYRLLPWSRPLIGSIVLHTFKFPSLGKAKVSLCLPGYPVNSAL